MNDIKELKDEEIKQVVGGTTTDDAEFIDESKESAAKSTKDKTPVFKADKAYKGAIK